MRFPTHESIGFHVPAARPVWACALADGPNRWNHAVFALYDSRGMHFWTPESIVSGARTTVLRGPYALADKGNRWNGAVPVLPDHRGMHFLTPKSIKIDVRGHREHLRERGLFRTIVGITRFLYPAPRENALFDPRKHRFSVHGDHGDTGGYARIVGTVRLLRHRKRENAVPTPGETPFSDRSEDI